MNEALAKVLQKKNTQEPITFDDLAVIIGNDPESFFVYMVNNDPAQVHKLLHRSSTPQEIGRGMSFTPNPVRLLAELNMLNAKKDYSPLNDIVENFVVNMGAKNWTTNPNVIAKLADRHIIKNFNGEYKFLIRFQ